MRTRSSLLMLGVLFAALPAQAQDATTLFRQGVAAFQKGDTATACRLFEQSYKLDAATGTLFNLATCHAKEHRYWQARSEFSKLGDQMQAAGKADKATIARKAATDAGTHLPRLELVFDAHSNAALIEIDGAPVERDRWRSPILLAPGSHVVVFHKAGMQDATRSFDAPDGGSSLTVQVPVLRAAPTSHSTGGAHSTAGAPTPSRQDFPPDRGDRGWTSRQTAGAVIGGVGVVALGVGSVFGVRALSQKSDADAKCGTSGTLCQDAAHRSAASTQIHKAQNTAHISTIAIGSGLVAIAAGAYLYFTDRAKPVSSAFHMAPVIGQSGGGLDVAGRF